MKNKKTLMIIILVFALVLIGASVLYSQLGKELAPDQLSVQSPQGAAISETKESEDNGDSSESQGADKKTERKETSTEEKASETEEQKENPVSEAEDGEVMQEETEKPETEKAEREEAKEKRVEAGQTEADKAEERSTETGQTEAESESKISAPDFTVYTKAGEEVKLSDYFGKPIVLNFWASWCGPCQMEMPDFNEKYLELEDEVNFLMVNMTGGRETVEGAAEFVEEKGYEFPVFYDTDMDAAATYGAYSLPTTYFIDKDGYVIAQAKGAIDGETLQRGLDLIKYHS